MATPYTTARPVPSTLPNRQSKLHFFQGIGGVVSRDLVDIDGPAVASSAKYTAYLSGEIIDPINWPVLVQRLRAGKFPVLGGRFAACVVDHAAKTAYLVSDYLSQQPLYFLRRPDGLLFSTSQAAFVDASPGFDVRWLYDQLAFNSSPLHRSFLRGVSRMPAASVCTIDLQNGSLSVKPYADRARVQTPQGSVKQQLAEAIDVFADRVPRYIKSGEQPVVALTSGFDSRTMLAFMLDQPGCRAYTYGVPGCTDIVKARDTADELGIQHNAVYFGAEFERQLPALAKDCVWRSGGMQSCIRSTIPYAFQALSEITDGVVLSGASGDQLFRGHGNVPDIVPLTLAHAFRTGKFPHDQIDVLADGFHDGESFREHAIGTVEDLQDEWGPLNDPAAALGYLTYVSPAEHFVGEMVLADQFVKLRTPFCDPEIVQLAHRISLSSLGLSKFHVPQDNLRENSLPAHLIALNPRLRRTRIKDRPLSAYRRGNRAWFMLASLPSRLAPKPGTRPPLEDWNRWARGPMRPVIRHFLSGDTRLAQYLRQECLERALSDTGPRLVLRLLTIEMLLTLIDSGWHREYLTYPRGGGD